MSILYIPYTDIFDRMAWQDRLKNNTWFIRVNMKLLFWGENNQILKYDN